MDRTKFYLVGARLVPATYLSTLAFHQKRLPMAISVKRTQEAVVLELPLSTTPSDIQNILNYFEFVELAAQSEASQDEIDALAKSVKKGWFERNKSMFEGHVDTLHNKAAS